MPELDALVELYCPQCGYDLRHIASQRCPECGQTIDRSALGESVIPWSHRKKIGRFRAFWRTVRLASRSPATLGREVARPLSYSDAQRFRWIVVPPAALPLCVAALIFRGFAGDWFGSIFPGFFAVGPGTLGLPRPVDLLFCWLAGAASWPVPSIALLLWLAGCTGVASYFFHPRSLHITGQNRAVAVSYYACAPLTMMFLPSAALGLVALMKYFDMGIGSSWHLISGGLLILGCLNLPIILFLWWWGTLRTLAVSTHCSMSRLFAAAVGLPLMWLVLALLTLGVLPAVCGFVKLMILSYAA